MSDQRPTKAERREKARVERERIARRAAARRRARTAAIAVGVVGTLAVVVLLVTMSSGDDGGGGGGNALDDLLTTEAPWPNNTAQMPDRVRALELPGAGDASHIHVPIWLFIDGEEVPVPADVGIGSVHSPIHMHEANRQLHVESADPTRVFNLGEFFDVWGVRFTSTCIGGHCEAGGAEVRVFSGGELVTSDPRAVPLEDQKAIVVTFGTEEQLPDPVPTSLTA